MHQIEGFRTARSAALLWLGLVVAGCSGLDPADTGRKEPSAQTPNGACAAVILKPSVPGPLPLDGSVVLTAQGGSCDPGQTPEYQFSYALDDGTPTEFRAWGPSSTATFDNSGLPSGKYTLRVRVRNAGSSGVGTGTSLSMLSGNVCPTVSLSAVPPSPGVPGMAVNFQATAACTQSGAEYEFVLRAPGQPDQTLQGFGGPDFAWDTQDLAEGTYTLVALARGTGNPGAEESSASLDYTLSSTTTSTTGCRSVTVTPASPGPLPSGSAVALTASGVSCSAGQTAEYEFRYRRDGGPSNYTVFRPFGTSPTASFSNAGLPSGKYSLQVRVRNVGSSSSQATDALTMLSGNVCTQLGLGALPASPRPPGTDVTVTAVATCTEGAAEYQFEYRPEGATAYSLLRSWGPADLVWDTSSLGQGDYEVHAVTRGAGNTTKSEAARTITYSLVDKCTTTTVSVAPSSPKPSGTAVTVTGAATCPGGLTAELHYVYQLQGDTEWTEFAAWGTLSPALWNTAGLAAGSYRVQVQSRPVGYTGDAFGSKSLSYVLSAPLARPPVITSNGGGAAATVLTPENEAIVTTVTASDPDPETTLTYSIAGGDDSGRFTIDAASGVLSFVRFPDFEAPADTDFDNRYDVIVAVSDGSSLVTQALDVTVTDVSESDTTASLPTLAAASPVIGHENAAAALGLRAVLTDTDGSESLSVGIDIVGGNPPGLVLSDGVHSYQYQSGYLTESVDVSSWDLPNVTVLSAPDSDADILLLVTATSTESETGATAQSFAYVSVLVISEGTGVERSSSVNALGPRVDGPPDPNGAPLFGGSVGGGGDVNGDGYDDIIVGALGVSAHGLFYSGSAYVVFGGPFPFAGGAIAAAELDGVRGFRIDGVGLFDNAGSSVAIAGDVNRDGFDDILVAARSLSTVYLISGHGGTFLPAMDLSEAVPVLQTGYVYNDLPVSGAGDVNADGLADFLVGDSSIYNLETYTLGGGAVLLYGSSPYAGPEPVFGPIPTPRITPPLKIVGSAAAFGGAAVSSAGDMNGDGYDDIIIGTTQYVSGQTGFAHVLFGSATGYGESISLGTLDDDEHGFQIGVNDPADGVGLGTALAGIGDVNADGYDDVVLGAPYSAANGDAEAGRAYVMFGRSGGFAGLEDPTQFGVEQGFAILGAEASDRLGTRVSGAGDVNGDGVDDLVVATENGGASLNGGFGEAYLIYGQRSGFTADIDLASLSAEQGTRITGTYMIGSLSRAGDLNGDGCDDIVIGSPNVGFNDGVSGTAFTVYGNDHGFSVFGGECGNSENDDLVATARDQILIGGQGNDVLDGAGVATVLKGGAGDDVFVYAAGDTTKIVGGSGYDTLRASGMLDLTAINASAHYKSITGIEAIDLRNGTSDTLFFDERDLLHLAPDTAGLSGVPHAITILGGAGDAVSVGPEWTRLRGQSVGGLSFSHYISSNNPWVDLLVQYGVGFAVRPPVVSVTGDAGQATVTWAPVPDAGLYELKVTGPSGEWYQAELERSVLKLSVPFTGFTYGDASFVYGTYVYELTVTTLDEAVATTQVSFDRPRPQAVSNFRVAQVETSVYPPDVPPAPGQGLVELNWDPVPGAVWYHIVGRGLPDEGRMVPGAPFSVSVDPGPSSYTITPIFAGFLSDPATHASDSVVVRVLPSHSPKWISKPNGAGTLAQVQTPQRFEVDPNNNRYSYVPDPILALNVLLQYSAAAAAWLNEPWAILREPGIAGSILIP